MLPTVHQREAMELWATEVKLVRNVVSVLSLQLKYRTELSAPLPARLLRIPKFRALGPSGVYAEWLRITVEQLRITEALAQQRGAQSWRDARVASEVHNLFTVAKTLLAILFRVRDRSPHVLESLGRLEALASLREHRVDGGTGDMAVGEEGASNLRFIQTVQSIFTARDHRQQH